MWFKLNGLEGKSVSIVKQHFFKSKIAVLIYSSLHVLYELSSFAVLKDQKKRRKCSCGKYSLCF